MKASSEIYQSMAAVVIGRNEGPHLASSLLSVQSAGLRYVYVDSGSSDGSCETARSLGAPVVELDPKRPFSAARGRNEGFEKVVELCPSAEFILFLDGDCTIEADFLEAALAAFREKKNLGVVTGHLFEKFPNLSKYNRLCQIEWRSPAGEIRNHRLGGIMVANVAAFRHVGGFNASLIAGEEPDLALRLASAGFKIIKIDKKMAVHDAQMHHFGQWWLRAVRGGKGIAQLVFHHRQRAKKLGSRQLSSALFWGLLLPLAVFSTAFQTHGISLLALSAYGLLAYRIFRYYCGTGLAKSDAWLGTRFIIYSKFAETVGIIKYVFRLLIDPRIRRFDGGGIRISHR